MRSRIAAGLCCLAVVTAGCTLSRSPFPDDPEPTPSASASATAPVVQTPTPAPTSTELLPVFGPARWTVDLTDDNPDLLQSGQWRRGRILQVKGLFLITAGLNIRAYSADGKERWHRSFPDVRTGLGAGGADMQVYVSDGAVIVVYGHPTDDRWPHPDIVEGLNPLTGKGLWKTTASPYVSVTDRTVFTPVCRHKQTGAKDDCRLSARDPKTGRPRWTVDAEHVAKVIAASPRVVVLSTKPMGFRGKAWVTTLSARTGSRLGARAEESAFGGGLYPKGVERVNQFTDLADDTLVLGSSSEKNEKRCVIDLEGRNARTGAQRWKQTLRTAWPRSGEVCRFGLPDGASSALFATTAGSRPQLFDLKTGRTRWRGPFAGDIVAGNARFLVVRQKNNEKLALFDLAGRTPLEPRWTIDGPRVEMGYLRVTLTSNRVVVAESGYQGCASRTSTPCGDVFDLATGRKLLTTNGEPAGVGEGWVADRTRTDDGASFSLYPLSF